MREILSRGKRMDNGEWAYGMPWIFKDHSCICPWKDGMCKYDTGFYPVQVEPSTVGQYTGLNDKNGKLNGLPSGLQSVDLLVTIGV